MPTDAEITDEVRTWLGEHWDTSLTLQAWWRRLAEAGLAFPTWPEGLGGRNWSAAAARMVTRLLAAGGVLGPPAGVGQTMGAPTLLAHGTEEQRQRFVPPLARGEEAWCQLFSEPGAGSDLAALRTSADWRDGEWRVSGQKVWNSGASTSDRGLLLARTDPATLKHRGITYFVVDMTQPGIEARPLRQMNGHADFDEVFLTDAVVPADRQVGALGDGWRVAQTTLAFERTGISSGAATVTAFPGGAKNGLLHIEVGELLGRVNARDEGKIRGYMLSNRVMVALAAELGRRQDPLVRQGLAAYRSMTEVNRLTGRRGRATARRGARPGPESSVGKLAVSRIARSSRDLSFSLLGASGMLAAPDGPHDGAVVDVALSSFAAGIGGGTDEIQRNIVAEKTLGLPREPSHDRDVPFGESGK